MLRMHMGMVDQGGDVLLVFRRHWDIQMTMGITGQLLWGRGSLQDLGEVFLLVLAPILIIHQIDLVAHPQVVGYPMGSISRFSSFIHYDSVTLLSVLKFAALYIFSFLQPNRLAAVAVSSSNLVVFTATILCLSQSHLCVKKGFRTFCA